MSNPFELLPGLDPDDPQVKAKIARVQETLRRVYAELLATEIPPEERPGTYAKLNALTNQKQQNDDEQPASQHDAA